MLARRLIKPTRRDVFIAILSAACIALLYRVGQVPEPSDTCAAPPLSHVHQVPPPPPPPTTTTTTVTVFHTLQPTASTASPPSVSPSLQRKEKPLMPSTKVMGHAPGWTLFENLYMSNGTLLIISDASESSFPERRFMTSTGAPAENTPENIAAREPTDLHIDYISHVAARSRYGSRIHTISATSILYNDPRQFIDHFYHFAAELFLGTWRMLSGFLYPSIDAYGRINSTTLTDPARVIFANCGSDEWRDYSEFNQYILHAAFPSVGIETKADWAGRISMTKGEHGPDRSVNGPKTELVGSAKAWRFDRVLLVDRSAAFRGPICGGQNYRTAAEAFHSNNELASPYWWEPIRRRLLRFARVSTKVIDYSVPVSSEPEFKLASGQKKKSMPVVITYVNRQRWTNKHGWTRKLNENDHVGLVAAIEALCKEKRWEFIQFFPETLTKDEQLAVAARTTIMLGVHGNGLTHLITMPPTPVSAVIEIFFPGGFSGDYQWTAEALGIKHFAIWNDTIHTTPNLPRVEYPEGFQSGNIPVHGPTVAKLIADRIEGRLPAPPIP